MTAELAAQVMSAPSFESVQELGEAWHTVAGYPRELLSDASMFYRFVTGASPALCPPLCQVYAFPVLWSQQRTSVGCGQEGVLRARTCSKCSAARVRELSSYHWETLKLMFVGQRHPGQDPGCVFAQLDNDAIRIAAAIAMESLLRGEGDAVRNHSLAPWRGLLRAG